MVPVETRNLLTKVNGRVQYAQEIVDAFDKVFAQAAETTAVNGLAKQKATSDNTQLSIREIVDENGKNYGIGVYLDSDLLSNLTEDDRIKMVKEYVKEIGGSTFTAYDNSGKPVEIYIAKPNEKFINSKGKKVPVNKDITTKYNKSKTKQESVVLIDELVITSRLKTSEYANKAHGWLDNNGNNKWDYWRTFIQDKNNAVWEATLNIATTENGKKYLYDIDPIKMVAGPVKSGTNNHQGNDTTVATESQETFSPTGGQLQLVDNPDNATPTANPDVRLMLSDVAQNGDFQKEDNNLPIFNDPYYPKTKREQSAFNRSFANKTSDLKRGQEKTIFVFTNQSVYCIVADGYMSGRIISSEIIDDNIENFVKEWQTYVDGEADVPDEMLKSIRVGTRRRMRNIDSSKNRRATRQDVEVDEKPYYRKPRRSIKERLADSGIDLTGNSESNDVSLMLADYIDEYGEIEPGENPAREVHLPKKTKTTCKRDSTFAGDLF